MQNFRRAIHVTLLAFTMSPTSNTRPWLRIDFGRYLSLATAVIVVVAGALTSSYWLPGLKQFVSPAMDEPDAHAPEQPPESPSAQGDHSNAIVLSSQAQDSIGIKLGQIKLRDFERTVTFPAIVAERRGRSRIEVGTPLAAEINRIFVSQGEAVRPGQELFELRLTHDELVQLQANLLQTAEELQIVKREVARLEQLAREGALAGRSVLERKYEQQKLEATLRVRRQAMLLHTFSDQQIDEILQTRRLLGTLLVRAPTTDDNGQPYHENRVFQLEELRVERGQHVEEGTRLAMLTDHHELVIEGDAFEQDAPLVSAAWQAERPVTAILEQSGRAVEIKGLRISHLANSLDAAARTQHFYLTLPNEMIRDTAAGERRFVEWKYKPGQRLSLRLPVETLTERIVVPVDAVAQDGVENYVFLFRNQQFHRQAVQVEHRDPLYVVVANDGSLRPGRYVALSGAQQILLALKNQSGGGVDPHAGHNH